jgi:hypothetical protein
MEIKIASWRARLSRQEHPWRRETYKRLAVNKKAGRENAEG